MCAFLFEVVIYAEFVCKQFCILTDMGIIWSKNLNKYKRQFAFWISAIKKECKREKQGFLMEMVFDYFGFQDKRAPDQND